MGWMEVGFNMGLVWLGWVGFGYLIPWVGGWMGWGRIGYLSFVSGWVNLI